MNVHFHWKLRLISIPLYISLYRFYTFPLTSEKQMTLKGKRSPFLRIGTKTQTVTAQNKNRNEIHTRKCVFRFLSRRAQSRNRSIDLPALFYNIRLRIRYTLTTNNRTTNRSRLCKVRDFSAFTSGDMQNRREPFVPVAVR